MKKLGFLYNGIWKMKMRSILFTEICEHAMLTETYSGTQLRYVQERKVLFFINNFIEADFFPL